MLPAPYPIKSRTVCRGWTMVELLVGCAILAILIVLAFPMVESTRKSAQSAKCSGNLKQVMMATQHYAAENNGRVLYYYYDEAKPSGRESWWRLEFRYREYLGRANEDHVAYCPSLPVNKSVLGECYGMRLYAPPVDSPEGFVSANTLNDQNQRQVYTWLVLNHVARPSAYPFYADSANRSAGAPLRQGHRFSINPMATGSTYGVHLRHGGRANVAFLDGHVEALPPKELKEYGILSGYDDTGELIPFYD